jgi:hypothetical protein
MSAVFPQPANSPNGSGFKKCACTIFVSGTLDGGFKRKRTGKTTWDGAHACAAVLEATGSWDGKPIVTERLPEATPPRNARGLQKAAWFAPC